MQHRRNEALDRGLEAIDVDRAGLEVLQRRDMGLHAREFAHHALELGLQDLPGRRERHPLGAAIEDRRPKLMFKFRNLPADRGRRDVQPFRSGPDRARIARSR